MSGSKNPPTPHPTSVREAAIKLLADLDGLIGSSDGVAGLHLNGDLAPWSELVESGRFECWLGSVETLRLALQAERTADEQIPDAALVREGIDRIRSGASPELVTPQHVIAIVEAADKAFEFVRSFGVRHDADMRAIRRWQSAEPSRDVAQLVEAAKALLNDDSPGPESRLRTALRDAIDTVERYSIDGAADRTLIWPDHADLLVWLLELLEVRPSCPSPDEVDEMIRRLRAIYTASPMIHDACAMMERLANALIASSRRTVQAESDRAVIPQLIVGFLRASCPRSVAVIEAADRIEAGEWLPLRGSAIRARRAAEVDSGCDIVRAVPSFCETCGANLADGVTDPPVELIGKAGGYCSACHAPNYGGPREKLQRGPIPNSVEVSYLPPASPGPTVEQLLAHSTATVDLGDGPVEITIEDGIATLPDGSRHHVKIEANRGPSLGPDVEVPAEPLQPRFYDGLRTVLQRPDVKEAIAHAVAAERGADWQEATEAGRNAFREEAEKLLAAALAAPRS